MTDCFYNNEERIGGWSFDERKEISKQMNVPVVHAIIYHDHETLFHYLKLGNINVNEDKFTAIFVYNSIWAIYPSFTKYKLYVKPLSNQFNLIDVAVLRSINVGVLNYLIRFGGILQYDHLQAILYCESKLFQELLLLGSLTYTNVSHMRQILQEKLAFSSFRSKKFDKNFANILDVAENWHVYMILYCLSLKKWDYFYVFN